MKPKPYRMWIVTRDPGKKQEHSEGPYEFKSSGEAVEWLTRQRSVEVVQVRLCFENEVIAELDMR